jgi:TolB-like protein/Flp pilus assembly protein TadD
MEVMLGSSKSPKESIKQAFDALTKAKNLDDSYSAAHSILGFIYIMKKQYDKGMAECEHAVALEPNSATALIWMSLVLTLSGHHQEAVQPAERAVRLDPLCPPWWFRALGQAYAWVGRYEEAISAFKKSLQRAPDDIRTHIPLTCAYSWAGRLEEARAQAQEVLRINPKYCLKRDRSVSLYKNKADRDRYLDGLRKAGLPEHPPLPLPDKPSIAVLPFVNMSGDPEQEYFSDGITEEIITALSKTQRLFVIARNSTFIYKGKPLKVQQVGRELGVKYVLEGSIRKSEGRIRITAQLIDATDGNSLWAERYDRPLGDIFDIEDEITLAIVRAMRVNLTEGEQASLTGRGTKNLDAYLKAMQAQEQYNRMNNEGSAKAKKFAKAAIAIDPNYALPYTTLANAHMLDAWFKFSKSPRKSMELASETARKALSLDDSDPNVYSTLTNLYVMQRRYSDAISTAKSDLQINPGGARAHLSMGLALLFACRFSDAIPFFEQALRLNPYPPHTYYRLLGSAYRLSGRFEQAIDEYKKSLRLEPNDLFTRLGLIVAYVKQGRDQEAKGEAHELLRIHPGFSVGHFTKTLSLKDQSVVDDMEASLRKAGLK